MADRSIVVTADILLADRALKAGAMVIAPTGKPFTTSSIGNAVAVRAIMSDLRAAGYEAFSAEIPDAEEGKHAQVAAFCWQVLGQND